ncbi:MAG: hypothetical protein P8I39_00495 [Akkermansiaceae bacterium]|nr:hypothetical protein [Akkermansiaceae bacterium]
MKVFYLLLCFVLILESRGAKPPKDRLAFAEIIVPIMEEKCHSCHSEAKDKGKGGLWMDTFENMLIGGDSQDGEEFRTLVPGNSKNSYMIEVIALPKDDDMHMPPPKKTQMESHEIKLITWWVDKLPEGEILKDQTLAQMGASDEILAAAAMLASPEERKQMEAAQKTAQLQKLAKREALQSTLATLKQEMTFKTSLNFVSQDSSDLEFTAVSLREKLTDEMFLKIAPVSDALSSLKLGATSVTDNALKTELPRMTQLKKLDLSQTQIGDKTLETIGDLGGLEWLNLWGTQVTDSGLMKLKDLSKLRKIYLWQSQVTKEGAAALKKELPDLEVIF